MSPRIARALPAGVTLALACALASTVRAAFLWLEACLCEQAHVVGFVTRQAAEIRRAGADQCRHEAVAASVRSLCAAGGFASIAIAPTLYAAWASRAQWRDWPWLALLAYALSLASYPCALSRLSAASIVCFAFALRLAWLSPTRSPSRSISACAAFIAAGPIVLALAWTFLWMVSR